MNSGPVGGESFSRNDRLRKRRDFQECYASGVRVSGRLFQVYLLRRPTPAASRLGISVPRRVGGAVVRNRLRRRLREIFRRHRDALAGGSFDIVIHARPGASRALFAELLEEYVSALSRAGQTRRPR